ncbi:MAG: EAL domain-containing protein [Ilumatobacteraceae bacterium]
MSRDGPTSNVQTARLADRPAFMESVHRALALAQRQQWGVAVFALDVDSFHKVNEDFGYDAGDEVLAVLAERLGGSVREHDTKAAAVTRMGGNLYLVLCEAVPDAAAAGGIARRLTESLSQPLSIGDWSVQVSVSAGISLTDESADAEQLVLDAEAALRRAQELGPGRHQFFDVDLQRADAQIEALRRAVAHEEFRLVYQPKVSLTTDRIVGVEALLRWHDPDVGVIGPNEFIHVAESSGLIVDIGAWVLCEACRQAAAWRNEYPRSSLTVAVNVSARQFRAGLADLVRSCLTDTGLPASALCIELTETTVMDDIETTVEVLRQLKRMGLSVSIDDFGTGYSSLEYLHRLPIDEVKIDRSFIDGLGIHGEHSAIVASVISLAHAMQREVVAEGVETAEQLERLRSLGCDLAQGFLVATPTDPDEIGRLIAADAAGERLLAVAPSDDTGSLLQNEVVLVVDDAADVRQLAQMSLTAAGFVVEEAGSGAAGVTMARRLQPSCVLLDLHMPGMNGLEVCKELRAQAETRGCTIVMLTTSVEAADKAEAFLIGADDYIIKPFAPRDLVSRVRAAIKRRRDTVSSVGRQIDAVLLDMLKVARDQTPEIDLMSESEKLSTRQLEVLRRLLAGERVPSIARALYLSQSTVRNHLSVIFQRLGVHSQEELIQLLRSK